MVFPISITLTEDYGLTQKAAELERQLFDDL